MEQIEAVRDIEENTSTNDACLSDALEPLEPETLISKFGIVHDADCCFGDGKFELKNGDTFQGLFKALKTGGIMREGQKHHEDANRMAVGTVVAQRCLNMENCLKDLLHHERNGVYTTVDGHVYDGFWTSDVLDCPDALICFPDGSSYGGPIDKMKYNGQGRYEFPDGTFMEAKFSDNLPVEGEESSPHVNFVDRCGIQWFGETGKIHVTMLPVHQFIPKEWKVMGKHVPQLSSEGEGITIRPVIPKFIFPKRSRHIFGRESSGA